MWKWLSLLLLFAGLPAAYGQEPLLPIDSAGYFRLINSKGQPGTPWIQMDEVVRHSEINAFLCRQSGKWGIANDTLQLVIPAKYDTIYSVFPHIYAERPGRLDIYSPELKLEKSIDNFDRIEFNTNPNLNFAFYDDCILHTYDYTVMMNDKLEINEATSCDDAFFYMSIIFTRKGTNFGFISYRDSIIEPVYKSIGLFNANVVECIDQTGHAHYYLTNGKKIPDSDSVLQFDTNRNLYKIYSGGQGLLYDSEMNLLMNYTGQDLFCIRQSVTSMEGNRNYLFAVNQNGMMGVIDSQGKTIIAPQYQHISYAVSNRFIVMSNDKFGVIDSSDNWIIEPKYTYIGSHVNRFFTLYDYGKKGVAELSGKIIVPVEFDELSCYGDGIVTRNKNGHGFYNTAGIKILDNEWKASYSPSFGFFEFADHTRRLLVDENGIRTPDNCEKIYISPGTIKYYLPDSIVVCHLVDGVIADSSVYPRAASMVISSATPSPLHLGEPDYVEFRSQLNGKIGALRKEGDGYEIEPIFDNVYHDYLTAMVKWPASDNMTLGTMPFRVKEVLMPFSGAAAYVGDPCKSYLGQTVRTEWSTSAIDPFVMMNDSFAYHENNVYAKMDLDLAFSRTWHTSAGVAGEINFTSGQPVMPYRDYFLQLNSYYNLSIESVQQFSQLSLSPMIYVNDPTWQVFEMQDGIAYKLLGNFSYFNTPDRDMGICSTNGGRFALYNFDKTTPPEQEFSVVTPYKQNFVSYFYVQKPIPGPGDISELKWTVYQENGPFLPGWYDSVKAIHSNYYIITQNNVRQVIDKSGKVIYTFVSPN